jgi:hypothetical protein
MWNPCGFHTEHPFQISKLAAMLKLGSFACCMHILGIIMLCVLHASAEVDYAARMRHIEAQYKSFVHQSISNGKCTPANLIIRKEW